MLLAEQPLAKIKMRAQRRNWTHASVGCGGLDVPSFSLYSYCALTLHVARYMELSNIHITAYTEHEVPQTQHAPTVREHEASP